MQGKVEDARTAFKKAVEFDPKEVEAVRGMVRTYRADEDAAELGKWLARLQKLDPVNPDVYRMLARAALKKKDEHAAAEHLVKAVELDNQDYDSCRELVRLFMARGDYAAAASYIDRAIAIWPYDRRIHEWGSVAFAKLGRKDRAEREKALMAFSKEYEPGAADRQEIRKPVEP
jgi:Tfp pilus assembly protein PilF